MDLLFPYSLLIFIPTVNTDFLRKCEGEQVTISCAGGLITIIDALYGRQDLNVCPHSSILTDNCAQQGVKTKLINLCENKPTCTFTVSSGTFGGDPCQGTYKYGEFSYTCVNDETTTSSTTTTTPQTTSTTEAKTTSTTTAKTTSTTEAKTTSTTEAKTTSTTEAKTTSTTEAKTISTTEAKTASTTEAKTTPTTEAKTTSTTEAKTTKEETTTSVLTTSQVVTSTELMTSSISTSPTNNISNNSCCGNISYCTCICTPLIDSDTGCSLYDDECLVKALRKELVIETHTLSSFKRTKTSAHDSRTSSKIIGLSGLSIIIATGLLIVIPDIISFILYCSRLTKKGN